MKKLKLDAFNGNQLQTCLALLYQCEAQGISDISVIATQMYEHVNKKNVETLKVSAIERRKRKKAHPKIKTKPCPECKDIDLVVVHNPDGLAILGCPKCRYSELVG